MRPRLRTVAVAYTDHTFDIRGVEEVQADAIEFPIEDTRHARQRVLDGKCSTEATTAQRQWPYLREEVRPCGTIARLA